MGVPSPDIREGYLQSNFRFHQLRDLLERLAKGGGWISNSGGRSVLPGGRTAKHSYGIEGVFVDVRKQLFDFRRGGSGANSEFSNPLDPQSRRWSGQRTRQS